MDELDTILWDLNNATGVNSDDSALITEAKAAILKHYIPRKEVVEALDSLKDDNLEEQAQFFAEQFRGYYTKQALDMPEKFGDQQLVIISEPHLVRSLVKWVTLYGNSEEIKQKLHLEERKV